MQSFYHALSASRRPWFSCLMSVVAVLVMVAGSSVNAEALTIDEAAENFTITSGGYRWVVSKTAFSVFDEASVEGTVKLEGGEASADFLGSTSVFGPPSEFLTGGDWVELRGWADQEKKLWYVARYRFFEGKPFAHLALSLMDRHDDFDTEAQWDDYWEDRILSNYSVTLKTTSDLEGKYFRQMSSFSGRDVNADPDIIVYSGEGAPFDWRRDITMETIELTHGITEDSDRAVGRTNYITWVPGYTGQAQLTALLTPFGGAERFKQAEDVVYEIQHAGGIERLFIDQSSAELDLGTYQLDENSAVTVFTEATFDPNGIVRARALRVQPEGGAPFEITFKRLADDVLQDNGYALGVVDLWQHWPIEAFSSGRDLVVNAVAEPAKWSGGIGLTLDLAVVVDATRTKEALAAIKAPPANPSLPEWWSSFDGTLTPNDGYDQLIRNAAGSIAFEDERDGNFGWRGYGDYQISLSYSYEDIAYQNWGGLQYDLTLGLLLGWMRTGDLDLWHRARSALRHQMDVGMAKFYPYQPKSSGHLYRKGECDLATIGTCQDPIPDFGYGYRAFLLWHHLTGEAWAKELAHQQIDALAYFSARSGGTVRSNTDWLLANASRPAAWIMRGLYTGAKVFPEGTQGFEEAGEQIKFPKGTPYDVFLDEQLAALVPYINEGAGYYPSDQPVWSGQGLEAMAMAYLDPEGQYRTDALKQAIVGTCNDLANSASWLGGAYDFVYERSPTEIIEWTDEPSYGWLWLSGLEACSQIDDKDPQRFAKLADDMYGFLLSTYRNETEIPIRIWSSILGFGGYHLARHP